MNSRHLLALALAAVPLFGIGQENAIPARQTNLAFIAATTLRDQTAASNRSDRLVRRGLLADKTAGTVRLWAEATGLEGKETEFFLISEDSGHDYEALAVAFCRPGDVRDALLFLGLPPGRNVDYGDCQFWPKGERVLMTFRWTPPSVAGEPAVPAEAPAELLIFDKARKAPLPAEGFVFTGSRHVPHPQETNRLALAADLFDPHSIASDYNDPDTILDVPHQAPKNAVYGWRFPNPDYRFAKGQMVEVIIRPERTDGSRRVRDLALKVVPAGTNAPPRFRLEGLAAPPALETQDVGALLAAFQAVTNKHQDPFVSFLPEATLPLDQVRLACAFLDLAENQAGVRVEPPADGHLYFRAFLPDEKFKDRAAWIVKPWELELVKTATGATGTLTMISEKWTAENEEPELITTTRAVESPEALRQILASVKKETPVMVLRAPADLPYGILAAYGLAALPTHPTLWVFLP